MLLLKMQEKASISPILSLPFNALGRILGRWALFDYYQLLSRLFINNYPGNKSDLGSIERVIDESEGKKTAETWNASFIEASAKIPGGSKVLRLEGPPRYPS